MKKILMIYIFNISLIYAQGMISMTLTGDEILLSLGLKNKMVGVCGKIVDNPEYSNIVGETRELPRVEGNLENILYLKPDIVIAGSWISKEKIEQLEKFNVKVLKYESPNNFTELKELLLYFGEELNATKQSEEKIKKLELTIKNVKEKSKKIKKKKKVLLYSEFGITFGKNTIFDEISKIGNFINIASISGINGMGSISEEKIVEYNPEVLLILTNCQKNKNNFNKFLKNRAFRNIDAVKNKKIYCVESKALMNLSPYIIETINKIFYKVYSELEENNEGK